MSKYWLIVTAIVCAGSGYVLLRDSDAPQLTQTVPEQAEIEKAQVERASVEPEIENAPTPKVDPDFQIDPNRLYDITYETDPALVAFAEANPLIVWLVSKSMNGLQYSDDVLEVESATTGYEIYLTVAKFSNAKDQMDEVVTAFEQALTKAGVDLAPIQERADQRFARLTQGRQELVGEPWGN